MNVAEKISPVPTTPMMQQYWQVKERHKDCLLFYRMGDFYELFYEDAVIAAADLEITLTKRGKQEGGDIPMCGVPAHSHELYLAKLIQKGHKVAICDQLESPEAAKKRGAKGPLQRDVVRIVTSGTLTEDGLLSARRYNFLVTLSPVTKGQMGVAAVDVSTGIFTIETTNLKGLAAVLARLEPAEIVTPDSLLQEPELFETFGLWKKQLSPLPQARFDLENGRKRLEDLYQVKTLEAFGNLNEAELRAAGALVDYLHITQKQKLQHLQRPRVIRAQTLLMIDPATRRSLELTRTQSGEYKGSLLDCMDQTVTSAGARLLAQRLAAPLLSVEHIEKRLDQVEFFANNNELRAEIQSYLKLCPDMERSLSRLSMGRGTPRDLGALRQGLGQVESLKALWQTQKANPFTKWIEELDGHTDLYELLKRSLFDELPAFTRDGGFVASGYQTELDHYRQLRDNSRELINQLQQQYIQKTTIATLKIRHNNILGYHIDISPSHASKVPTDFIHRQTLASSMRYTTVELAELEKSIEAAAMQTLALELTIFEDLREAVHKRYDALLKLCYVLANFDVASALAELAVKEGYTRPTVDNSLTFSVKGGRHPIVAKSLKEEAFVANDCEMNERRRILLMTGPNMAGKSTYLRQNALITIMGQMGSFVPAEKAHIGIVDRVFSRVGASDDLASGRSTFMVEMVETATILHQATKRSFVILDEIGRGTATFDGLAIAWAVTEGLYHTNQCRTMFATHYHELTRLADELPHIACLTMKIQEWQGKVIFLHQVIEGCADKSYGVHVAALAGLPEAVVQRAEELLTHLEKQQHGETKRQLTLPLAVTQAPPLSQRTVSEVEKILKDQDIDLLTPRQALELLYRMKEAL